MRLAENPFRLRSRGDACNPAFAWDLSRFIVESEARLWVHGHIHYCCDYTLGKTRVWPTREVIPRSRERVSTPDYLRRCNLVEKKTGDKNALDVKQSASAAQFNRQSDRYGKSHILADTQDLEH